ncbi:hypothetical protein [Pseudomonas sp. PLMAX]|uniref:hypothetical protein n=1 Tax=Pseudomonas sp. PLMAX TaxID=2201998 RepID=UPI0038B6CD39
MSKGKGAGVYMTAQELEAIDNALDLISTTLERASVIPPELSQASEGLHSLMDKFHAATRRVGARRRQKSEPNAVSRALAMIAEEEKAAGSSD